jgi:hypothetical protein
MQVASGVHLRGVVALLIWCLPERLAKILNLVQAYHVSRVFLVSRNQT